jgi:1-acyl-sn-glycerol-3-phosphate acyltransferase
MDQAASVKDIRALVANTLQELLSGAAEADRIRFSEVLPGLLERASEAELAEVLSRVSNENYAFGYHPPIELARQIQHVLGDATLAADSSVEGVEHLRALAGSSVILLPNHLSYSDANVIEVLLYRAGLDTLCRRLTAVAGPKVYSEPWKRFSSLCFGTIKTAQSSQRASGDAVMRPREVARIARQTIACAFERLDAGDALLLFPEGARSRDGTLLALLPAVARYCERPGTWLVPLGIEGTERLMGFGERQLRPARVVLRVGAGVRAEELCARCEGNRGRVAEALGQMIAGVLSAGYRGVYG